MKKISEITRRDIIDIIRDGFIYEERRPTGLKNMWDIHKCTTNMPYWGRLSEIEFLGRVYPLASMPSNDRRFPNAYGDIIQHNQ